MSGRSPVIGIDLGTTNSVVAVMEGGHPKVIANCLGSRSTPSVVGFLEGAACLVGQPARNQQLTNPEGTIFGIKHILGRQRAEIHEEELRFPFRLAGAPDRRAGIRIGDKRYEPELISALILAELKRQAEEYLGEKVERAVITVPAYFNDAQRQATKDAGEIAGLKVDRIINEPTAAALAYGLEKKTNAKVVVFDLGGGTFNVSILDIGEGVFEVLATGGDAHCGGDGFSAVFADLWMRHVEEQIGRPLRLDNQYRRMLTQQLVIYKEYLSLSKSVDVPPPPWIAYLAGDEVASITVARADFESRSEALLGRISRACERALADARLTPSDVDEVVMVGGSTRIPRVQELAKRVFRTENLDKSINPDEIVAIGAAIQGGVMMGDVKNVVLLDVTPFSLGVETLDCDGDETIAIAAPGEVGDGMMTVLIPRNTTTPTSKKEVFSTAQDNQSAVPIVVLQGECKRATDNRRLGIFELHGIAHAPKGVPQIEVEFSLDQNGILNVKATDKATGMSLESKTIGQNGLSNVQIQSMRQEAERLAPPRR